MGGRAVATIAIAHCKGSGVTWDLLCERRKHVPLGCNNIIAGVGRHRVISNVLMADQEGKTCLHEIEARTEAERFMLGVAVTERPPFRPMRLLSSRAEACELKQFV